jgi:hypothetical protein
MLTDPSIEAHLTGKAKQKTTSKRQVLERKVLFSGQRMKKSGCPWLMPVIPITQEAEIRRIEIRSQPGQIVGETLSQSSSAQKVVLVEWFKW